MQALWKQTQRLHPTFHRLNRCLEEDWFLLPHELKLQGAHAAALVEAGLLTADEHGDLVRGLARLAADHLGQPCPESDAEDLSIPTTADECVPRMGLRTAASGSKPLHLLLSPSHSGLIVSRSPSLAPCFRVRLSVRLRDSDRG